jgi:hypothetical protein
MIGVNIVNFITVGIIAVIAILLLRVAMKAMGKAALV